MPPVGRTCTECAAALGSRSVRAKTCSNRCRLARSRRIRRANQEIEEFAEQHNTGAQEIAAIVRRQAPDLVHTVMKEQLAPVIREALTEDVLHAIQSMLGLTPRAVQLLGEDLESKYATIRQRAYTLVTKYTIGHPALLQAEDNAGAGQLVVNFNLPRPAEPGTFTNEDVTLADAVQELAVCDMCNEEKSCEDFESGSTRCSACFAKWRDAVLEQFS